MIVLDTNVVSELMRGDAGDPRVRAWVSSLDELPVTTVLNQAEILSGIAVLPGGRRRDLLRQQATEAFGTLGAVLPFDADCPAAYGDVLRIRRELGRPIGRMDALIASIAIVAAATIATRDITDFDGLGIDLVNPWAA